MDIPSYLSKTGLPPSVCHVLHVLSGTNQLEALRLAKLYEANVTRISRLEIEKAWRERQAQLAIASRTHVVNKAEAKRAARSAGSRAAIAGLLR